MNKDLQEKIENTLKLALRYGAQYHVMAAFFKESIHDYKQVHQFILDHEPRIRQAFGDVGYFAAENALPLAFLAATAGIGYLAVKGSGLVIDEILGRSSQEKKPDCQP